MNSERPQPAEFHPIVESEKPRCECGVFAVYAPELNVAREAFLASKTLQHRGHESAGIAVSDGEKLKWFSGAGLVDQVFDDPKILDSLPGEMAISHNRYSTTGERLAENEGPFWLRGPLGEMALAHNGNLTNREELLADLAEWDVRPDGTTDSEVAALWIAHAGGETWEENIQRFMKRAEGAYSMTMLVDRAIYAFRDPHGVRPLQIAQVGEKEGWAVSSETLTFRTLGYRPRREVARGEIIRIDEKGLKTVSHRPAKREALCIFEHVYFSRPDSELAGQYINRARKRAGRELADEHPVEVDVVTPVPQSGNPYSEGFADQLGLHHEVGFARSGYVGRSFISPEDRRRIVEMKLNPFVDVVRGKRVCVVDDSLVRGNTMPVIVEMLKDAGATEVHVRIGSPPIIDTCHLGVDIPTKEELIAARDSIEEIREHLEAHSLEYLSAEGMYRAFKRTHENVCDHCMTGVVPFPGAHPQSDS